MTTSPVHLRRGGVGLVVDPSGPALPRVVHWGADLGDLGPDDLDALVRSSVDPVPPSAVSVPVAATVLPLPCDGWGGTPGLAGRAVGTDPGTAATPRPVLVGLDLQDDPGQAATLTMHLADDRAELALTCRFELTPEGLLRVRHEVTRSATASSAYEVASLLVLLPLPPGARERLDLTGRWVRERHPQRGAVQQGTWRREGRHGRTGHDATTLLLAGEPGFAFRRGEVRGTHVAWSGNHVSLLESLPTGGRVLGGGELLEPGEVVLEPGQSYATPWLYASWSAAGIDALASRFHRWLRARPSHPTTPRPLTLNTWEAVYFGQDEQRLRALADAAATIGVERFVLDDGWFGGRRDDTAGLGDWTVSADVWPDGLGPLVDHVTGLGMQFGLWVEPEMVNVDSDLYRAHPEWVLGPAGRLPLDWRHQQVLDLANPQVSAYLLERLDMLLSAHDIAYLKWDHNRDLLEAVSEGRPRVHEQTLALYALLDAIRARHPDVEIESCASGGARIDLEILARTDRVWASDCNDALERQTIQRWTGMLLPPELIGAHVGPAPAHTTGRAHAIDLRAATALLGHAGIEADVAALNDGDRSALQSWASLYRDERHLLHSGEVVNGDLADDAVLRGVVAADGSRALYTYAVMSTAAAAVPGPVLLPGLSPDRRYRVRQEWRAGAPWPLMAAPPPWLAEGVTLPGRVLTGAGLAFPALMPDHVLVLVAEAVQDEGHEADRP